MKQEFKINVENLLTKYRETLNSTNYKKIDNGNLNPDTYLFQNWHHKIEKGWYGFSFGNVPMIWAVILNEFLIELDKETEGDFKILQNKLKYGSARLYYSYDGEKFPHIYDEINKLEKALFSKDLIY